MNDRNRSHQDLSIFSAAGMLCTRFRRTLAAKALNLMIRSQLLRMDTFQLQTKHMMSENTCHAPPPQLRQKSNRFSRRFATQMSDAYDSNLLRFMGRSISPFSLRLSQTFGGIPGDASQPGSGRLMRMPRSAKAWPVLDFGGCTVFLVDP